MTVPQPLLPFGGGEVRPVADGAERIRVLPLCYENAVSYGGGCGDGPRWLLEASAQLERLDEETGTDWANLPMVTLPALYPAGDPRRAVDQMRRAARAALAGDRFLLSLGGDHAVTIGPVAAAARRWPDLGVLQVDAHMDLRERWNGSRFNHACVMRRVVADMGLPAVQVGVRSFSPEEAAYLESGPPVKTFFAHEIDPADCGWVAAAVAALPPRVYLTIDLDGLDPSVLPGTGTPEPGGLSYRQLLGLLRELGRRRQVVAADITELAKIPGQQVSEFTAARIAAKILVHCVDMG